MAPEHAPSNDAQPEMQIPSRMNTGIFLFRMMALTLLLPVSAFAQSNQYPISNPATSPPFGLYRTSADYLNLQPSDTAIVFRHVAQMNGDGQNDFYKMNADGSRGNRISSAGYFAASDGKHFYVSYDGAWHKASRCDSGGYCFVSAKSAADYEAPSGPHVLLTDYTNAGASTMDVTSIISREQKFRFAYSIPQQKWIAVGRVKSGHR